MSDYGNGGFWDWPGWMPRGFATSQPYVYRDGMTILEYVQCFVVDIGKLQDQVNGIAESGNDLADNTAKQVQIIQDRLAAVKQRVEELAKVVDRWQGQSIIYNPTRGRYEKSRSAMRDMLRELAVYGARVDQMATLTTEQAAGTPVLEMAVIGNKTVFGNNEPRVTPVNPREDDTSEDHN